MRVMRLTGVLGTLVLAAGCGVDRASPPSDRSFVSTPADRTGRIDVGSIAPPRSTLELVPDGDVLSMIGVVSTASVKDVRIDSDVEAGTDRVVYSFTGSGVPFWKVGYVAEAVPHRGGSPVPLPGRSIVQVDMMDTAPPARHLYATATPLAGPEGSRVAQLYLLPDVREGGGITQSFIGFREDPAPFEVNVLDDPPQLVIEFG
ncbi:hypothetical protein ABEU20_001639 [Rhodococcus sp. PAM 2766]|uniref:AMIN-like domain-containing protein n=1 Tax=Rhodococcus parequi TaxID=3137122 RepID=A0ABW9FD77_9NOCA